MFGIETFTPIVNQPDAAILGVCAVQDELTLAEDGSVSKRQVMRLSFTYDHRLIDGATAAKFVMDLRRSAAESPCVSYCNGRQSQWHMKFYACSWA